MTYDAEGRVDRLIYHDPEGRRSDAVYRLADYANAQVPHLILLLDSVPFETMLDRYNAGDFGWFDPPQKMIAPFFSLTEVCYTDVLKAPPLPGFIDQYFDQATQKRQGNLWRA